MDPKKASYGVENLLYAVVQLAQSAMRKCVARSNRPLTRRN
jgi:regulator of protease activity HflC (stomatin/prohibitin superfamily)